MSSKSKKVKKANKPARKRQVNVNQRKAPRNRVNNKSSSSLVRAPVIAGVSTRKLHETACVLDREEFLGGIFYTTAPLLIAINAGNAALFPWLSLIAANFEFYHFEKLELVIRAVRPTTTPGKYYLAIDYDSRDAAITTINSLMNFAGAVSAPIWVPETVLKVEQKAPKYVLTGAAPINTDIRLYNVGNFNYAAQSAGMVVGADVMFEVTCRYRVRLISPKANNIILNNAYSTPYIDTAQMVYARRGADAPDFEIAQASDTNGWDIIGENSNPQSRLVINVYNLQRFTTLANTPYFAIDFEFISEDLYQNLVFPQPLMSITALGVSAGLAATNPGNTRFPMRSGYTGLTYTAQEFYLGNRLYAFSGGAFSTCLRVVCTITDPSLDYATLYVYFGPMAPLTSFTNGQALMVAHLFPVASALGEPLTKVPKRTSTLLGVPEAKPQVQLLDVKLPERKDRKDVDEEADGPPGGPSVAATPLVSSNPTTIYSRDYNKRSHSTDKVRKA